MKTIIKNVCGIVTAIMLASCSGSSIEGKWGAIEKLGGTRAIFAREVASCWVHTFGHFWEPNMRQAMAKQRWRYF